MFLSLVDSFAVQPPVRGGSQPEHGENIYAKRFLELIIRNILEFIISSLKGGIIDKDVDCAERIDGFPSHRRAYALLSDVTGEQDGFASRLGDQTFGLA